MVCRHHEMSKHLLIYYISSLASPSCATYQLSYDDLTYSLLSCASTSEHLSIQPLPSLPTYTQLPETVSPSLTSSSPSSHTPTPSQPAKVSRKTLVEITVQPVVWSMFISVLVAYIITFRRRRREMTQPAEMPNYTGRHSELYPAPPAEIEPLSKNHLSFFPPRDGLSIQEWELRYLSLISKESKFLAFLSSYGSCGVPLRELIMLGTLRQSAEKSKNHWLKNGELGSLQEELPESSPKSRDKTFFLDDFMDAVCDSSNIEYLQTRLEDLGLIDVEYPKGSPHIPLNVEVASQYWYTDERIWILRADCRLWAWVSFNKPTVAQELLDVFTEMPEKDVSPAAQRQREIYYYHAHLHIRHLIESEGRLYNNRLLLQTGYVVLQLLTHRYREDDALLLEFVQKRLVIGSHPHMDVMWRWAELKENAFRKDYNGLCTIRDRLLDPIISGRGSTDATPRYNGLLGFILVDLMNSAKTAGFTDIVSDVVEAGMKWIDRTSNMKSTLERTALCEALAAFNVQDRTEVIPQKYHLFYGYHLSRVGLLAQSNRFLASGLKHYDLTPWWPYEFERISIALRLRRQNQAAQMLNSLKRLAFYNRDEGLHSILWKRSGECAEVFVLLDLYEADSYASTGRLDDACAKLESGIAITSSMYDAYIRTLRVTLKMRLLEVRMWKQNFKEAIPLALDLACEVLDPRPYSTLAPDAIYGVVLQLLNLSNTLLSTGDAANSWRILQDVLPIPAHLPGVLSVELESYLQQRVATVRRFGESTEPLSKTRTLLARLEELAWPHVEHRPTIWKKKRLQHQRTKLSASP